MAWLIWQTHPVDLPELQMAEGERLDCLSYAPYHLPGQTPLDPAMHIPRAQIAADLAALAPLTRCVRIYAVDQGLEAVPEIAASLGMKVLLGAWIGRDAEANRKQMETAAQLANAYPGTIRAVVVGNEVMLRRELAEADLKKLLEAMRARVLVPVTYADVWEYWLKYPELADSVDFLSVHILPYWEDEPVAVEAAVAHVAQVRETLQARFGKPVLIGETGWPSQGRQRAGARPGRVEQAHFLRSFVEQAHANDWDYNLIEAIDQPWKRQLEGTVGGYWGLLAAADMKPKFPWQGPLAARDDLKPVIYFALGAGTLGLLLGMGGLRARMAGGAAGAWTGAVLWLAWEHAQIAYRSPLEWGVLGGVAATGLALVVMSAVLGNARGACTRWMDAARLVLYFAAATAALLIFADPRYRDFPYWLYWLPLPALLAGAKARPAGREAGICAAVIVSCGTGRWAMEPLNPQAQAWLALCLLWGAAVLASNSRASRLAGAESSAL